MTSKIFFPILCFCLYVQFGSLYPPPSFFLDILPMFYGDIQQNINRLWVDKYILEQEGGVKCSF